MQTRKLGFQRVDSVLGDTLVLLGKHGDDTMLAETGLINA